MTRWLVSSTGTHHVPEHIDNTTGEAEAACGRYDGEAVEADPDPEDVCEGCLDAHPNDYGLDLDDEPAEQDENGEEDG